jgi:hypothetical protein
MLRGNTSIHTIHIYSRLYSEHELYRGSLIPYLETNQFRPRLLAIQKAHPIVYRVKVLGRALLAVRTDPNRFWMLFRGIPMPATAASTASVMSTLTTYRW